MKQRNKFSMPCSKTDMNFCEFEKFHNVVLLDIFIRPGGRRRRVAVEILVQGLENILMVLTRKTKP